MTRVDLESAEDYLLSDEDLADREIHYDCCRRHADSIALGSACNRPHNVCERCSSGRRGVCEAVSPYFFDPCARLRANVRHRLLKAVESTSQQKLPP